MNARFAVLCAVLASACAGDPEPAQDQAGSPGRSRSRATERVDPALLNELLGESVRVQAIGEGAGARDDIHADGMLVRLAFDPLIRETGPVGLQQVQGQGYRLTGVVDGSPLWLLGLRDGDVLTAVDKQAILGREHELRSTYESRPNRAELTFLRGAEQHSISLWIGSGSVWRSTEAQPPPSVAPRPSLTERRLSTSESALATLEFASGIRCSEDPHDQVIGRCEIERKALDGVLENPEVLARQARVVPHMSSGQPSGFKLYGIRPSSIPYLMGMKNGDRITKVNGASLDSVDAALTAYSTLAGTTEFGVDIVRKDRPMYLELVIVDALSGPAQSLGRTSHERRVSPDLRDPFPGR